MDEFNSMLAGSNHLSEEQINTCRDIRRRGKNKIAAQNCRKRKVDQITNLAVEVEAVRDKKSRILSERVSLALALETWQDKLRRLETFILHKLGRGPDEWALEFLGDSQDVSLVPRAHGKVD